MVLQAQAQATAVMAQANTLSQPPTQAPTLVVELAPADQREATPDAIRRGPEPRRCNRGK
jgi:hypothetical protein